MSSRRDPLELLRELADRQRTEPLDPSTMSALFDEFRSAGDAANKDAAPRRWWHRLRKPWVGGGLALVIVGGGAAAWAALRHEPAPVAIDIICADRAQLISDPDASVNIVVVPGDGSNAIKVCEQAWARGDLNADPMPSSLIGCVSNEGIAIVFPGDTTEVCDALGLPPLDPQLLAEHRKQIQLQQRLSDYLVDAGCLKADALAKFVEDEIRSVGLAGWNIETGNEPTPQQPCALAMLVPTTRTVLIDHWPNVDTSTTTEEQ